MHCPAAASFLRNLTILNALCESRPLVGSANLSIFGAFMGEEGEFLTIQKK